MTIKVGINYPGFNFGWDFGQQPTVKGKGPAGKDRAPAGKPAWYDKKNGSLAIVPLLECLKQMGVEAVRWFILGDGWTFDLMDPLFDDPKKVFSPPPISKVKCFREHFVLLLETFHKYELLLMPVLLDHTMFGPPQKVLAGRPDEVVNLKAGRSVVATDPDKRKYFIDNTVKQLIAFTTAFQKTILAWDVMNEPEETKMDKGVLQPLLVDCLNAVKDAGLSRTIGWQKPDTAKDWSDASALVTAGQFHYYPDDLQDPNLPEAKTSGAKIIGEIATETRGKPAWKELGTNDSVEARIRLAEKKGYEWVFLWSVNGYDSNGKGPDRHTRWDDTTRKSLVAYTGKQPCAPQGDNIGDLAR